MQDTVSVEVDGEEVEVDVSDVLEQLYEEDVMEYFDVDYKDNDEEADVADFTEDAIIDYLKDEFHRGAFSDFNFNKLFEAIGIADAVKV
jgi:hypothetical protein